MVIMNIIMFIIDIEEQNFSVTDDNNSKQGRGEETTPLAITMCNNISNVFFPRSIRICSNRCFFCIF